ncbi:MAG: hypothetical protein IJT94_05095 [Oscillibacter sp.]|nr:hypothetical protein [Oscillibacter sp.]
MTDLEVMQRAKMYLDQLANGLNPLTGQPVPDGELLNNVRISRCLFYVSDVLRQVIENGGTVSRPRKASGPRRAFTITPQQLAQFPFSDTPLKITEIVRRINELSSSEDMKQLQPVNITEYLREKGFMELLDNGHGKQVRLPTEAGYSIGLTADDRVAPNGQPYTAVFYNRDAQQFVIDNMEGVLAKLHENQGSEGGTMETSSSNQSPN